MSAPRPNPSLEIFITRVMIAVTLLASVFFLREMSVEFLIPSSVGHAIEALSFVLVVAFLIYGNLSYQATRIGYFKRLRSHVRTPRYALEGVYDHPARPL